MNEQRSSQEQKFNRFLRHFGTEALTRSPWQPKDEEGAGTRRIIARADHEHPSILGVGARFQHLAYQGGYTWHNDTEIDVTKAVGWSSALDKTTAIRNAVAEAAERNGATIVLPAIETGEYIGIDGPIPVAGFGIHIRGVSMFGTAVHQMSATSDTFQLQGADCSVSNMNFVPGTTKSAGAAVAISGLRSCLVRDCLFTGGGSPNVGEFTAISVASGFQHVLENIGISDTIPTTGVGIDISGGVDIFLSKIIMDASGTQPLAGIRLTQVAGVHLHGADIIHHGTPFLVRPVSGGSGVGHVYAFGFQADSSSAVGVDIDTVDATAGASHIYFTNSWAASCTTGISVKNTGGSTVQHVYWDGRLINNTKGAIIGASTKDVQIRGSINGGATATHGVHVAANTNDFTVDAFIGTFGAFTAPASGVVVDAGTSDRYRLFGDYTDCATDLTDGGSGANKIIMLVGQAPGGELGGTWAAPTVDTTHSGSSHAGVISTHEAAADPHTGYLKESDFDDVDFLVGTATGHTGAEIVVGTAPGGELGGTWASPTVDATHSGSSHAGVVSAHEAAVDPHTGYRLESADHSHATTGLQGGTVAHGALTGVTADQHHAQSHGASDHTDRAREWFVPATEFMLDWNTPDLAVRGSNGAQLRIPGWAFDPTTGEGIAGTTRVPRDWDGGGITGYFVWAPTNTNTGTVVWQCTVTVLAAGEQIDGVSDGSYIAVGTPDGTAENLHITSGGSFDPGSAGANVVLRLNIFRLPADGSDTYTGDAWLFGMIFEYTADS